MEVRYLGPPRQLCPGSRENWVGYYPWAIRTRHNNTRENCSLNLQDGVQPKPLFYQFSRYFSFCCITKSIKWISSCILCVFTFGICNFRHVGFHVRILVMRITVEVVPTPQDIPRCRAFPVVPGNPGSPSEISRTPRGYPGFMWTDKLSKQRNTCAPGYPCPRDMSPHVNRL